MLLIHPITLLLAGLALALSPVLYFLTGNELALILGLNSISESLLWLWALAAAALCCGFLVPVADVPARQSRLNPDRLYGLFLAYTILQIAFVAIVYAFLGYLPIFRVPEGFDIAGMNDELGEAGGFFGLYLILLLPYLGLAAHLLTTPSRGTAGQLGKIALAIFAIFLALLMAKMQALAILVVATVVFWMFRMSEERGRTLRGWHYTVLGAVAVAFLMVGGAVNVFRAGNSYDGSAFEAGLNWLVRYSLFPFINISSIVDQTGLPWIANKCYFLAYILPASLRQDYCSEVKDFVLPVMNSPSGYLSPPFTSWGLAGLGVFSFFCGIAAKITFKRAKGSYAARFLYALMAWALVMIGTYNDFLNAYFMYYPAILFFLMMRFVEDWVPSPAATGRVTVT
jgi:hypothetical protein